MKKTLVSFADHHFYLSQYKLIKSAKKQGILNFYTYVKKNLLHSKFYKTHNQIFKENRGFGFWIWKPFIILETLSKLNQGDILIYSDSGIEIINSLDPLFELLENTKGVMVFNNCDYTNKIWTKRDCFILMEADEVRFWDAKHIEGAFLIIKKNSFSESFTQEWLDNCSNYSIINDENNLCGKENLPQFRDHRHDQSVLSILVEKYKLEIFRSPTQYGNHYKAEEYREFDEFSHKDHFEEINGYSSTPYLNSNYFTLLNHHRTKTNLSLFQKYVYENFRVIPGSQVNIF